MQVIKMDKVFLVVCKYGVAGVSMTKEEAVRRATDLYKYESYDCDYGLHVRVEMWSVEETQPTSVWVYDECREWWN